MASLSVGIKGLVWLRFGAVRCTLYKGKLLLLSMSHTVLWIRIQSDPEHLESVVYPDRDGIQIQRGPWIRIRIRNPDPEVL